MMNLIEWSIVITAISLLVFGILRMLRNPRERERAMLDEYGRKEPSPKLVSLCGDQDESGPSR